MKTIELLVVCQGSIRGLPIQDSFNTERLS